MRRGRSFVMAAACVLVPRSPRATWPGALSPPGRAVVVGEIDAR